MTEGKSSSKHTGVRALFDRDWVKPERVPQELGRFFREMFKHRQAADHGDVVEFDVGGVRGWLTHARAFVATISELTEERLRG